MTERELTQGERTLLGHLQALEGMLRATGGHRMSQAARGRVSARAEEARAALRAKQAKVEAVIREQRKHKVD